MLVTNTTFSNITEAKLIIEGINCLNIVVIENSVVVCVQPKEVEKAYLLGISPNFDYVISSYHVLLYREPDIGGETYWLELLNNGTVTKEQVYNNFINSKEYKDIHG
jgi:hypothetical protein